MSYELKNIPAGSDNFYWYHRTKEGGRQKSRYIGKTLPPAAVAEQKEEYEAARTLEKKRTEIEQKIKMLQAELHTLNK
jgi:hypothetical protein